MLVVVERITKKRNLCRCDVCGSIDEYEQSALRCFYCRYRLTDKEKQFLESIYPSLYTKDEWLGEAHWSMILAVKYIAPCLDEERFIKIWKIVFKCQCANVKRRQNRVLHYHQPSTYCQSYDVNFLDSFSPQDRQIVYHRFVEDLTYEEIGQTIGLTKTGVRHRIQKILNEYRRYQTS